jgi:hypothetical protein
MTELLALLIVIQISVVWLMWREIGRLQQWVNRFQELNELAGQPISEAQFREFAAAGRLDKSTVYVVSTLLKMPEGKRNDNAAAS